MNSSIRALIVSALLLSVGPLPVLADQWFGGRDGVFTIETVDRKTGFAQIANDKLPICLWEAKVTIRRKGGGIIRGKLEDLKPGVQFRAYGAHSSSPFSFMAKKIIIQP